MVETETLSDLRYEESLGSVADLSYQSSFSSVSLAPSSPSSQSVRKQPALLRLSPSQDLVFSPNSYGDLTARIQMWNVSPGPVAFKMKTTTPERFKVRPSNGCLSPGQSSMMDITVTKSHMSQSANLGRLVGVSNFSHLSPLTSVQDKFLISAISVSGEDLAPPVINAQLKSSKPDAQYRFRCLLSSDKVIN